MTYGNNSGSRTSPLAVLGCIGIAAILVIAIAVGGYVFFGDRLGTDSSVAAEDSSDNGETGDEGAEGDGADDAGADEGDSGNGGGEGSTVQPGDLSYTFVSMTVDYGNVERYEDETYVPDGQFVKVEMEVENHGDELITFMPVPTRMVDGQGVEHEHHIEATSTVRSEHERFREVSGNLEPGDSGLFQAMYDIPADEEPSHLLVSDMGFGDPQASLDLY